MTAHNQNDPAAQPAVCSECKATSISDAASLCSTVECGCPMESYKVWPTQAEFDAEERQLEEIADREVAAAQPSDPRGAAREEFEAFWYRDLPQCETTMTPRLPRTADCDCDTYPANLGPCIQIGELGPSGKCPYCDHAAKCHLRSVFIFGYEAALRHAPVSPAREEEWKAAVTKLLTYIEDHGWGTIPEPWDSIKDVYRLLGRNVAPVSPCYVEDGVTVHRGGCGLCQNPGAQHTICAVCLIDKPTPLRIDWMGGYVCLSCINEELENPPGPVMDVGKLAEDIYEGMLKVEYIANEPADAAKVEVMNRPRVGR